MKTYIKRLLSQEVAKKTKNQPTIIEDEWTIPDGQDVIIERFYGGHEAAETEVRITLLVRDGASDMVVYVGYAHNFDIKDVELISGNGSKKIVIQLINGDNGALHMTGIWRGVLDG